MPLSDETGGTVPMTPNQLVAWNLKRAREAKGWTQEEACERLEPFLGERWTRAAYSAAESSWRGKRIRHFDADDLYAFARCFGRPIAFFFLPGPGIPPEFSLTLLDRVFLLGEETRKALLDFAGSDQEGAAAIARWTEEYSKLRAEYEERISDLLAAANELRRGEQEREKLI